MSQPIEIWINPACSKCRTAQQALDEAGADYVVRRYLDEPPTVAELTEVLHRMGLEPWDITRPKETHDAGIEIPKDADHRNDWLVAMSANPMIIQRPIITATDGTTVIARDPDTLDSVIP